MTLTFGHPAPIRNKSFVLLIEDLRRKIYSLSIPAIDRNEVLALMLEIEESCLDKCSLDEFSNEDDC